MTTTHTNSNPTTARNLLAQITLDTKMRLGMREFVDLGDGLRIKIGNGRRWLYVQLTAADLYDVKVVRMARDYSPVTVHSVDGVDVESLNAALRGCEGR